MLNQVRLPDDVIADVVHDLSHTQTEGQPGYVNYRDMSVQQLGSIYERLLEQEPVRGPDGQVRIRPNPYARKDSGSFYTPQDLVNLIVEQTLKPLVDERRAAFEARANELRSDRRPKAARKAELARLDTAVAVLDLKVLDPAMGSGHFLVTAVDFLTDAIVDLIEPSASVTGWLGDDDPYHSPLLDRVAAIRDAILQRADESGWQVKEAQLTDQAIIRRLVLKRCIYGVDKNPLTVELAKVSLWLHSFTVGAPLSFLDHHLRCGDSLLGLRVLEAVQEVQRLGGLFAASAVAQAEAAASAMQAIEAMSDADVGEVRQSAGLFQDIERATADLRGVLDFLCGVRWRTAGLAKRARAVTEGHLAEALARKPKTAFRLLARGPDGPGRLSRLRDLVPSLGFPKITPQVQLTRVDDPQEIFAIHWHMARSIADREGFLHWEVAFPGVWRHWQNQTPAGGFDAVIGNPPWDRIKLQEVEWFATRDPELARAPTAAARREGIRRLREQDDPLAEAFDQAKARADRLGQLIRASGHYPLLGGGDINLYSFFVERSLRLVKPGGLVGLLTPSGIYADKTAARFFKSVSTTGRVAGIFDFENRRLGTDQPPFFPDIDSRFKFCALIVAGPERRFPETHCGFFLSGTPRPSPTPTEAFTLSPDDFARVNPNTGTAPVFRTRRDADLTRRIYQNAPRLGGPLRRRRNAGVWPVRYATMFHMTNHSHLFRTGGATGGQGFLSGAGQSLETRQGPMYLPLYEGKMVQAFDHRAASVVVNPQKPQPPGPASRRPRLMSTVNPRLAAPDPHSSG